MTATTTSHWFAGGGDMGERIRAYPWSTSPLGPIEQWPSVLTSTLSICLSAQFPMAIYWGAEGWLLYNDAWRPILGDKHPWAMGRSARSVWPEIWDAIDPLFESVRAIGQATWRGDEILPMQRFGYTEECSTSTAASTPFEVKADSLADRRPAHLISRGSQKMNRASSCAMDSILA